MIRILVTAYIVLALGVGMVGLILGVCLLIKSFKW